MASAKNPRDALDQYAQPLQAALHCVTPAKLQRGVAELDTVELLTFLDTPSVELKRQESVSGQRLESVYLLVHQRYGVATVPGGDPRQYRVITQGYNYVIRNRRQREIVAFHWHPGERSHEHDPHVHIGSVVIDANSSDMGKAFSRFHIPTGHISVAQVVRLLLTDFNVVPNRQDWEAILDGLRLTNE